MTAHDNDTAPATCCVNLTRGLIRRVDRLAALDRRSRSFLVRELLAVALEIYERRPARLPEPSGSVPAA